MGYTWGYLRRAALFKLDLDENFDDHVISKWQSRFPTYANEVITQVCSTIKPKPCYFKQIVLTGKALQGEYTTSYALINKESIELRTYEDNEIDTLENNELYFSKYDDNTVKVYRYRVGVQDDADNTPYAGWQYLYTKNNDGLYQFDVLNEDFVSFSENRSYLLVNEFNIYTQKYNAKRYTLTDEYFKLTGYKTVTVKYTGTYDIAYNGRWINFENLQENLADETYLDVPNDILDCIPSYIAAQLYGIDDEYKAAKYRNEFEMLYARIDSKPSEESTTIGIKGDW